MPDIFDRVALQRVPASDIEVLPDPARRWLPASSAQQKALDCDADILMLGGAAGSLKTSTILVDLIAERDYPRMRSYFFRRTYAELTGGENAIDQSLELFTQTGAVYNSSTHTWRWPSSGAEFYFRHCQYDKDVHQYQSQAMTAVGIDESTHWPEEMARYLITRNRSKDRNLRIRARLGTNPGGIGHKWHKKVFMGNVCPHCTPDKAPPQGQLRWDARWSDGVPFEDKETKQKLSISYILSSVREHNKLGAAYIARLKMQNPATAKALLEGCWDIFEGQFFDCWAPNRGIKDGMAWKEIMALPPGTGPMVVPRHSLNEHWWWPRWVSSDYGFSVSISAAHLFVHMPATQEWPRGRVVCIDEDGSQETARNFVRRLLDRWVFGSDRKQIEYRWMPWYLSPDSFDDIGVTDTLAGQMNEVLKPNKLQFNRANNNRAGGANKIYSSLDSGELLICSECHKTIEAIETRVHDEDNENDVKKIHGEDLDDYYDSFRYGDMSWESHRDVSAPREVQLEQALGDLPKTDPTRAMAVYSQFLDKEKAKSKGSSYSGNARHRMEESRRRDH